MPTITLNDYVYEWPDVLDRTRTRSTARPTASGGHVGWEPDATAGVSIVVRGPGAAREGGSLFRAAYRSPAESRPDPPQARGRR
jgi:hypothetical protein